ncbi:barstar family protein [Nonomuraea sp. NPDC005692]|uniref:barstar family protein n=1 Tax=Nonomuraea sp. NPDC005692 TaxID=3157168 RepID=UPI0033C47DBB
MDISQPKFLLIDGDGRVLGTCLDAEGVFVEAAEGDGPVTVEILGCLPSQRLRDYLGSSNRYRLRNPLWLEGLRMLDAAGEPLADFWVSEIIEWRPSRLGSERADIIAKWGYDSPQAGTRHIWERWRTARPDQINQWAVYDSEGRREWLTLVGRSRFRQMGPVDRPAGRVYCLDGAHVTDMTSFYLAVGEAVNGPGGYFGWNLDALNDCLCGGFGATAPFTLVWSDSQVARRAPSTLLEQVDHSPTFFDAIQTIFAGLEVSVVLR